MSLALSTFASARISRLPRALFRTTQQWVHLVGAMLRGGFTPDEAGKIAGGNYMRIFRSTVG